MYPCPRCHQDLVEKVEAIGVSWHCEACGGQAMGFGVLRKSIGEKRLAEIREAAVPASDHDGYSCPMCSQPMTTATVDVKGQELTVKLCLPCGFIWFDAGEYEAIPPAPPKPHVLGEIDDSKMTPEMREKLALVEVEKMAEQARVQDPTPDEEWKTIPAMFGLPVEMDDPVSQRTPWATYLLSLLILIVSLAAFTNLKYYVYAYGLEPAHVWRDHGLTLLTSFFLHGGLFHLGSNLYFLVIFGRMVENNLGPWRWLLLVFAADQTGNLLDVLGDPRGDLPAIGASGGISGLLAYYALKFPQARLGLLFRLGYAYMRWIQFPAWVIFLLWILLQLYGAWVQISGFGEVACLAHLGGVAVGVAFWWVYRNHQPSPAAATNPLQIKIK